LNGIAYRPESESFLLTGKRWKRLFEVVFVQAD
jgi:glutamine cyclotransferase